MKPIWQQAFRPFFLFGSIFAFMAMLLWSLQLGGMIKFSPYGSAIFWHAHEMIFGFVGAIIAGFLLTAVQNWTGIRATHGLQLQILVSLWLAGRILIFQGNLVPPWLTAIIDSSFLLLTALFFAHILISAKQKRNLFLVFVLVLLSIANVLSHLSVLTNQLYYLQWGLQSAVMIILFIMIVITGRVVPMFTANGLNISKVESNGWLEATVLISMALIILLYLTNALKLVPSFWLGTLFLAAAVSNSLRVFRWGNRKIFNAPLVWSLHLSYWFIPFGFLLFSIHHFSYSYNLPFGLAISESMALHTLTAGAMGTLVLAMIARVSLGHTGRPLQAKPGLSMAFIMVIGAALLRILGQLLPAFLLPGLIGAAVLWGLGFLLFVVFYARILTTPRADGKVG